MILYQLCDWFKTILLYSEILAKVASSNQFCDWLKNKQANIASSHGLCDWLKKKQANIASSLHFKCKNTSCLLLLLLVLYSLNVEYVMFY